MVGYPNRALRISSDGVFDFSGLQRRLPTEVDVEPIARTFRKHVFLLTDLTLPTSFVQTFDLLSQFAQQRCVFRIGSDVVPFVGVAAVVVEFLRAVGVA